MGNQTYHNKQGANWIRENTKSTLHSKAKQILADVKPRVARLRLMDIHISRSYYIQKLFITEAEVEDVLYAMLTHKSISDSDWLNRVITWQCQVDNLKLYANKKFIFTIKDVESVRKRVLKDFSNQIKNS